MSADPALDRHEQAVTPIPIRPRTRSILLALLFLGAALLLRAAPTVPRLFLGGVVIALLLAFPVRLLTRFMPRGVAILTTFLVLILLLAATIMALIPLVVGQLGALASALPGYAEEGERLLRSALQPLQQAGVLPEQPGELRARWREGLLARASGVATALLGGVLGFVGGALTNLAQGLLMLLIAMYMLVGADRFREASLRLVPSPYRDDMAQLWTALGRTVSRYLAGLAFSMAEQGLLVALGLMVIGVPYAALLGVWFGMTAVIPYLGAILGAVPIFFIALFSSGPPAALATIVLVMAVNAFDSNIVLPQIQGRALDLHPIVTLLAVIGGSELAGPIGAVVALPLIGMLKVAADFLLARIVVQPAPPPVVITVPGQAPDIETAKVNSS